MEQLTRIFPRNRRLASWKDTVCMEKLIRILPDTPLEPQYLQAELGLRRFSHHLLYRQMHLIREKIPVIICVLVSLDVDNRPMRCQTYSITACWTSCRA